MYVLKHYSKKNLKFTINSIFPSGSLLKKSSVFSICPMTTKIVKTLNTSTRGFTFVELIVTIAMSLIALTAFLPVLAFVSKGNSNNKLKTSAMGLAATIIEELRAIDYDHVGTLGGNPTGTIAQNQTRTIDGINFQVETLVSWKAATGQIGSEDVVAFKEARVIVKSLSPFSNTQEQFAELTTSFSREGQKSLVQAGHLRFTIRGIDNNPIAVSTNVNIFKVGLNESLMTDYDGVSLFGIIPADIYNAKIDIPTGYLTTKNENVGADGKISRVAIGVLDWLVTDEKVYMDKAEKFCTLSIHLIDSSTGNPIKPKANLAGLWNFEAQNNTISPVSYSFSDYSGNFLKESILGKLWPLGTYTTNFSGIQGFNDFVMQPGQMPKLTDGSDWNGVFSTQGENITLNVNLSRKANYFDDVFSNGTHTNTVSSSNTLKIDPAEIAQTPVLVAAGSTFTNSSRAFDNNFTNYSSGTAPKTLIYDLSRSVIPSSMSIKLQYVTSYTISGSNDLVGWTVLYTSPLISNSNHSENIIIPTKLPYRYYKLVANTQSGGTSRIYEVDVNSRRVIAGSRISSVVPLGFTVAPSLNILWDATVPAGGNITVSTAISADGTVVPAVFTTRTSGESLTTLGEDLTGKYIWIKQELTAGTSGQSPILNWLKVGY